MRLNLYHCPTALDDGALVFSDNSILTEDFEMARFMLIAKISHPSYQHLQLLPPYDLLQQKLLTKKERIVRTHQLHKYFFVRCAQNHLLQSVRSPVFQYRGVQQID